MYNIDHMNTPISVASALAYKHVAKPLLFRQKPDSVHIRLLKTGKRVQRLKPARALIHGIWAYENEKTLGQSLHGIRFPGPVGLSAGFDKNFELPPLLKSIGFGFMEGGSLTLHECAGNPRPWFHRLPRSKSLVVHAGLANDGVHRIIETLQTYPAETQVNFPLNISIAKTNSPEACSDKAAVADYVGSFIALQQADIGDMYTINISCPNTYGGEPFTTPKRLDHLLQATDELNVTKPVFVKMPTDLPWENFKKLLAVIDAHQIDGVTISNLVKNRDNIKLHDPLPDTIKGGLSGKPTWDVSNQLIKRTYCGYKDRFTIIGVGGIFSAEDAYQKITYGASLVELITGMIFEGPQLIGQINHDLNTLLKRDGFTNIQQAIGTQAKCPKKMLNQVSV